MITIHDIQIFVMTYNRSALLQETIQSLLAQTIQPTHITVLDNSSPDNTEDVVKSFASEGVHYVRTTGFLGNFNKARKLVSKPYCMLFHDDDLLHPSYLETALKMLNHYSNLSLITCAYTPFNHGTPPDIPTNLSTEHIIFTSPRDWACYMYFFEGISYAPAIYRTKDFLQTELEYEKFNKFNDWPFLVKMGAHGNVGFLTDSHSIFARQHPAQDSNNENNFPNLEQIVNWDKCFFSLMNISSRKDLLYWIYGAYNAHFLLGKYNAAPKALRAKHSINDLKQAVKKAGLPTFGLGNIHLLKKYIFNSLTRKLRRKLRKLVRQDFKNVSNQ